MNCLKIILNLVFFFTIVSSKATNINEGHINSLYLPSIVNPFNYFSTIDLIVFGDSYSTTNTNYNSMKYDGKNDSGGKNWPLQLIEMHDMFLWNFACGGAPITNSYFIRSHKHPLTSQYEIFEAKMTKGKEFSYWNGDSSLFAFWFGINDIMRTVESQEDTIAIGHKILFNHVAEELYKNNAKNFLFFNIPPMEKSKSVIEGAFSNIPEFIEKFNTNLKYEVEAFNKKHPDTNVIIYNVYDEFNYILANHDLFNITDIKEEYIYHTHHDRQNYFWYDSTHPTDYVHKFFTDDLNKFLTLISNKEVQITANNSTISNLNNNDDDNDDNNSIVRNYRNNIKGKSKANLMKSFGIKRFNYHHQLFYTVFVSVLLFIIYILTLIN